MFGWKKKYKKIKTAYDVEMAQKNWYRKQLWNYKKQLEIAENALIHKDEVLDKIQNVVEER